MSEITIKFVGFEAIAESRRDGLSNSDEIYFMVGANDGTGPKYRRTKVYGNIDSGDLRVEQPENQIIFWKGSATKRRERLIVIASAFEEDGGDFDKVERFIKKGLTEGLRALSAAAFGEGGNIVEKIGGWAIDSISGKDDDLVGTMTTLLDGEELYSLSRRKPYFHPRLKAYYNMRIPLTGEGKRNFNSGAGHHVLYLMIDDIDVTQKNKRSLYDYSFGNSNLYEIKRGRKLFFDSLVSTVRFYGSDGYMYSKSISKIEKVDRDLGDRKRIDDEDSTGSHVLAGPFAPRSQDPAFLNYSNITGRLLLHRNEVQHTENGRQRRGVGNFVDQPGIGFDILSMVMLPYQRMARSALLYRRGDGAVRWYDFEREHDRIPAKPRFRTSLGRALDLIVAVKPKGGPPGLVLYSRGDRNNPSQGSFGKVIVPEIEGHSSYELLYESTWRDSHDAILQVPSDDDDPHGSFRLMFVNRKNNFIRVYRFPDRALLLNAENHLPKGEIVPDYHRTGFPDISRFCVIGEE